MNISPDHRPLVVCIVQLHVCPSLQNLFTVLMYRTLQNIMIKLTISILSKNLMWIRYRPLPASVDMMTSSHLEALEFCQLLQVGLQLPVSSLRTERLWLTIPHTIFRQVPGPCHIYKARSHDFLIIIYIFHSSHVSYNVPSALERMI